jgi:hypothetical protein
MVSRKIAVVAKDQRLGASLSEAPANWNEKS